MYILEDDVLPVSEKIKNIRKILGLKQEDITGGEISRSLISYIENGKIKLTKPVAEILSKSIKKALKDRGISLEVDADYLMLNEVEQAGIILDRYTNWLQNIDKNNWTDFYEEVKQIEKNIDRWDIPEKKAVIYELIGDFYYDNYHYSDSYINYIKAYECNIRIGNQHNTALVISKIARCCINIGKYRESINFNNYALLILERSNIKDELIHKRCLFNNALAYKKLGYYDKCLQCLSQLEDLSFEFSYDEHVDILLLKGNSYINKKNYNVAEELYRKIISIAKEKNDLEKLSVAYINISLIYTEKKDIEKSIHYNKKALKIREKLNSKGLEETLLLIGKKYRIMKQNDLAEKYLLRGLKEINDGSDLNVKTKIYRELLKLYISTNEHYFTNKLIEEVLESCKKDKQIIEKERNSEVQKFLLVAVNYYIDKDSLKAKEILSLLLREGDVNED